MAKNIGLAMKLSADLSLKQSLVMTNDMRLAIDMLAMTAMEIEQLIDQELEKNPYLEEGDYYTSSRDAVMYSNSGGISAFDVAIKTKSGDVDFRDSLLQQVGQGRFNALERQIAHIIINNIDDDGLLLQCDDVYRTIIDELGVFSEWIDSVRFRVMDLEPPACGATDIYESLVHQVRRRCHFPHREFLLLLEEIKRDPLRKVPFSRLNAIKTDDAQNELKMLHPRPSRAYHEETINTQAIHPDVSVIRSHDKFIVSLIKKPSDRLVMRDNYSDGGSKKQSSSSSFLRESRNRATFLLKSLRFRDRSLFSVSRAIVEQQGAWLGNQGPLKPMNLRDIAEMCGLHESSVSRLVRGKYLFCDQGVFELRYFFSTAVLQEGQDDAQSATFIKDQIRAIVRKEDKTIPLSDQKIQEQLKMGGVVISRRTVAKYRESLNLGPAHERRVLIG